MSKLKTRTLDERPGADDPFVTLCEGHVDAATFNIAHAAEGWSFDHYCDQDLKHEYWVETMSEHFIKCEKDTPRAEPMTARYW